MSEAKHNKKFKVNKPSVEPVVKDVEITELDEPAKKFVVESAKEVVEPLLQKQMDKIEPFKLDFKDIRYVRQRNNNRTVYQSIIKGDINEFKKHINHSELERQLKELEWSFEKYWGHLREDIKTGGRAWFASRKLSKCSSRQCSKDETEQLRTCNFTTQKYGINISNLSATAYRPTNDGRIISGDEIKKNKIPINICHKSFDGKIDGNLSGFISSKISFGGGGHQDNVFREQDSYADWWSKYKHGTNEILVLLIDTDLQEQFETHKKKYNQFNNICWFNHIEFQQYIIDRFHNVESK